MVRGEEIQKEEKKMSKGIEREEVATGDARQGEEIHGDKIGDNKGGKKKRRECRGKRGRRGELRGG